METYKIHYRFNLIFVLFNWKLVDYLVVLMVISPFCRKELLEFKSTDK